MLKKIIFACCLFCVANIASASANDSSMPREIVANFYHDYLVASEMPDMESADKLTQKAIFEYTTEHLRSLRDNDESGADYFVDAQDICEEWKDSINVETVSENDQVAQVKLILGYGKGVSLYAVNLVKEKGNWLMDSVKPISHSSIYCPRQAEGEE
ncbi:DUF3828 domain-containing protein [Klebsiella quasipneumoniae]|uniref:DUF3828 domain-containing protein n=1 Tax=Klebsiella TaxID=570 RepID=UPI00050CB9F7|nr:MULTISPECIES: DUF3828 domain-containing protein [Klebsiella]EIV2087123.1 DUF3828 domain-containing protein [Klebsiella pneumoniae subsp. ozaenae]HDS8991203.1 DUF3828 domain-containing protein [Klebsiella pneumoniae subsp. pneumoniae]AOA94543.1 hypothetical protein A8C02_03670 [Klebsiella pneumoniae]AWC96348.1 DUF3828 domain-containing protein [Klebsiella pneumoniae]AWD94034.1 DUF3828 domain-containing protein [Klebsiella pneumoniae]